MNSKKLLIPGKTYRISYEVCSEDTIEDMIIPFLDENVLVSNIQIMEIGKDILLAQTGYSGAAYYGWDTSTGSPIRRDRA